MIIITIIIAILLRLVPEMASQPLWPFSKRLDLALDSATLALPVVLTIARTLGIRDSDERTESQAESKAEAGVSKRANKSP